MGLLKIDYDDFSLLYLFAVSILFSFPFYFLSSIVVLLRAKLDFTISVVYGYTYFRDTVGDIRNYCVFTQSGYR